FGASQRRTIRLPALRRNERLELGAVEGAVRMVEHPALLAIDHHAVAGLPEPGGEDVEGKRGGLERNQCHAAERGSGLRIADRLDDGLEQVARGGPGVTEL